MIRFLASLIVLFVCATSHAASWYSVSESTGEPVVTLNRDRSASRTLGPNEYADDTVFPAVDPRYWKKQGKNWVEMSQSQKDKVDSAAKAEIVDAVNTDASLDALIKVIADLNNLSEKQVKDRMLSKVDKDKAHKAKKNRGK